MAKITLNTNLASLGGALDNAQSYGVKFALDVIAKLEEKRPNYAYAGQHLTAYAKKHDFETARRLASFINTIIPAMQFAAIDQHAASPFKTSKNRDNDGPAVMDKAEWPDNWLKNPFKRTKKKEPTPPSGDMLDIASELALLIAEKDADTKAASFTRIGQLLASSDCVDVKALRARLIKKGE